MGSGSLHGRQILDWSGKTAGAPGHRALTLPSGRKEGRDGTGGHREEMDCRCSARGPGKDFASPLGAGPPGHLSERPPSNSPRVSFWGRLLSLRC